MTEVIAVNDRPLSIARVTSPVVLEQCYALRQEVFVDEQKVPPWEELDAYDMDADHFAACAGDRVVGTLRVVRLDEATGKIGRVAVARDCRGAGIGTKLMQAVIAAATENEFAFARLVLDAQLYVVGFYERLGFVAEGEEFMDAGIPHRRMTLELAAS